MPVFTLLFWRRIKMKSRVVLCALLLLFPATLAFAGATCGAPTVVPSDGRVVDFDFVAQTSSNFYQFDATAGHSYSVEVRQDYDGVNNDLNATGGGAITIWTDAACSTNLATATTVTDTRAIDPAVPANTFRVSFTAPTTGTYRIQVANGSATTGRYISVAVAETTLYSTAFFANINSSAGSHAGFYATFSFSNTTSAPVAGTLTLVDGTGAVIGTSSITLPEKAGALIDTTGAKGTNATAITIAVGTTGKTGSAFFAHNGPPGAITTAAYEQNGSTGFVSSLAFGPARQSH
jgi:hypothetical protein